MPKRKKKKTEFNPEESCNYWKLLLLLWGKNYLLIIVHLINISDPFMNN
jgi:hypothetical protein